MTTLEKSQSFMEKFLSTPAAKKFQAQELREIQRKRVEHIQDIKNLEAEQAKVLPPLRETATTEFKKVVELEKKLEEAQRKCNAARREAMSRSNNFANKIANHEAYLRETYDPKIDEFLEEMNVLHEEARNLKPDILSKEKFMDGSAKVETNLEAQRDCRAIITTAIDAAEQMKLQAIDDIASELNKLRNGVRKAVSGFLQY